VIRRGGVAGNIAYAMGVLGQRPLLVGAVGPDFADYRADLERVGVDCTRVHVCDDVHTARFMCTTDQDMRQIASFYTGAMARACEISLAELAARPGGLDLVLIGANDPDALQIGAVVGEVGPDSADEQRPLAEYAHRVRDVSGHPAPPDHQVIDQEAERDPFQLVCHELVGEPAGKVHEVVGRDGSGHGDRHDGSPYRRMSGSAPLRDQYDNGRRQGVLPGAGRRQMSGRTLS